MKNTYYSIALICTLFVACASPVFSPSSHKSVRSVTSEKEYLALGKDNKTASWGYEELSTIGSLIISSAPNTFFHYETMKLSVDLPYNSNWGTEKYALRPFYEIEEGIVFFGPLSGCEGGGRCIPHWFTVKDSIPEESLLAKLQAESNNQTDMISHKKIGNKNVLVITRDGFCKNTSYLIPMNDYLFTIQSDCDDDFSKKYFADIILSLK